MTMFAHFRESDGLVVQINEAATVFDARAVWLTFVLTDEQADMMRGTTLQMVVNTATMTEIEDQPGRYQGDIGFAIGLGDIPLSFDEFPDEGS